MVKIIIIFLFSLFLIPESDSKKTGTNNNPGYIDISVVTNLDTQNFIYSLRQMCLPVPGITELVNKDLPLVRIKVPVSEFKCTNRLAYRDFLTTMKATQYPWLEINIPPYSEEIDRNNDLALLHNVNITVAGATKSYDINCKLVEWDNEHQVLNGTATLKLTDFGIAPPVRYMGLVRVKNEIGINFEFCLSASRKLSITPVSFKNEHSAAGRRHAE